LQATVSEELIRSYQELAQQLSIALHHEEKRCEYLSEQKYIMLNIQDDVASEPEGMMLMLNFRSSLCIPGRHFWCETVICHYCIHYST